MRAGSGAGSVARRRTAAVAAAAVAMAGTLLTGQPAQAAPRTVDPQQRIEAIADRTGFDWRAAGGEFVVGCAPSTVQARCTMGAYVTSERRMYVSPRAFATPALLEYVVLHELAHLWQFTASPPELRVGALAPFGYAGVHALEVGADCLARHWGSRFPGHYGCPAEVLPVVGAVYASTVG